MSPSGAAWWLYPVYVFLAVMPFFASTVTAKERTVDDQVVIILRDSTALIVGAVLALFALIGWVATTEPRGRRIALWALAFGVWHLFRGMGWIGPLGI